MKLLLHKSRTLSSSPLFIWRRKRFAVTLCMAAIAIAFTCPPMISAAQAPAVNISGEASEERVKAAFLYRFPSYVEWPASSFPRSDSPYVIGVINDDVIADEILKISAGRIIYNRPVTVRKIQPGEALNGIHVLFISRTERAKHSQLLKQSSGQAILVVTEDEGALAQGSTINFRIAEDRVRFEVSVDAAEKSGLKLSSRLLAIAISVIKGTQK